MHNKIRKLEGLGVFFAPQPIITVLDVEYLHLRIQDGSDLYVTKDGLPFTKCLLPEHHWEDRAWMKSNSTRLPGASSVYHVTTKEVERQSRELTLK